MSHQIATAQQNDVNVPSLTAVFSDVFGQNADIRITHLTGDLSSRNYYRILNNKTLISYILQQAEQFDDANTTKHPFLSAQRLFKSIGVPVPAILATHGAKGWILQEDLGNSMLQQDIKEKYYDQAVLNMAKIHCKSFSYQHQQPHFEQSFDTEKLQAEMLHTHKYLLGAYFKLDTQETEFLAMVQDLTAYLAQRPRFMVHRDYHSRNLMIHSDQVYVIDFQDARMGPLSYDLVSLVWDPYVQLSTTFKNHCLSEWTKSILSIAQNTAHRSLDVIKDKQFMDEVLKLEVPRMKVQRLLKACGSYAAFFTLRGRKDFLHCIRPSLEEVHLSLGELVESQHAVKSEKKLLAFIESILENDELY